MRCLLVAVLALVSACTPAEAPPSTMYAKEKVGFDVTPDPDVRGQFIASGSYVDGQGVKPEPVKWHTLLKGLEAVRKDGYDLVVWSGPVTPGGTWRMNYRSTTSPATSHSQTSFRGFIYVVRGYRSTAGPPPEAHPVGATIDQVKGLLAREKS